MLCVWDVFPLESQVCHKSRNCINQPNPAHRESPEQGLPVKLLFSEAHLTSLKQDLLYLRVAHA